MSLRLRVPAVCVLAAGFFAANASGHPLSRHETPVAAPLLHMISWHRGETHRLQRLMGVSLTPTEHRERQVESTAFRMWILDLWKTRHHEQRKEWKAFLRGWQAQERNAFRAIRAASSFWGVSYGWLVACAQSEGLGNGGSIIWTPNWAGASGPFQFLSGTFYSYAPSAFAAAARRGVRIPRQYLRWSSTVGQSWTAAYMFSRGLSHHWYGAGC